MMKISHEEFYKVSNKLEDEEVQHQAMLIKILNILLFERNITIVATTVLINKLFNFIKQNEIKSLDLEEYFLFERRDTTHVLLKNKNTNSRIIDYYAFKQAPFKFDYYFQSKDMEDIVIEDIILYHIMDNGDIIIEQ